MATRKTQIHIKKGLDSFEKIEKLKFLCKMPISKEIKGIEECDCKMVTKGTKGCGETCLNRQTFMECPPSCFLGIQCSNKQFQVVQFFKGKIDLN